MKVFFFNILFEDFTKIPFLAALLDNLVTYTIDCYLTLNEDSLDDSYNFRYLTILQLLGLVLTRSTLKAGLLFKLKESKFLAVMTDEPSLGHRREIFIELLSVFNKLVSKKTRTDDISIQEIDAFIVSQQVPEFVWNLFHLHIKKQNLIFSACANFFHTVETDPREEVLMHIVACRLTHR